MDKNNLKYCDDDVNLDKYIMPKDFDLEKVILFNKNAYVFFMEKGIKEKHFQ